MNNKGIAVIRVTIIILGLAALYFIYKFELVWEFINFIKGYF